MAIVSGNVVLPPVRSARRAATTGAYPSRSWVVGRSVWADAVAVRRAGGGVATFSAALAWTPRSSSAATGSQSWTDIAPNNS